MSAVAERGWIVVYLPSGLGAGQIERTRKEAIVSAVQVLAEVRQSYGERFLPWSSLRREYDLAVVRAQIVVQLPTPAKKPSARR